MRFVDTFKIRLVDDAEFESKHGRDKNGRFSSGGSGGSGETETPKVDRKAQREAKLDDLRRELRNGARPADVVRNGARALVGEYDAPAIGDGQRVTISAAFVRESGKYFFDSRSKGKRREIAERQLECYTHVEELLASGKSSGWRRSKTHHSDYEFKTLYKRFPYKGKNPIFAVDVRRKRENDAILAHNATVEGNPGFQTKKRILKMDSVPVIEVIGVQVL